MSFNPQVLRRRLEGAIIGYPELKAALVAAYLKKQAGLPRGHVLFFGPPGVGKTYATKAFAAAVAEVSNGKQVAYARIQGRADLMPEEFLAERVSKYDDSGRPYFAYQLGTIGKLEANGGLPAILQFDELDKTPGRTQHGLLEAMEEQQLSLPDGRQIPLSFVLVATANTRRFDPASQPIPRATQDRFGSVVFVDYLPLEGDLEVLSMHVRGWNLGIHTDPAILAGLVTVVKLSQRKLDRFSDFAAQVKVPCGPRGYLDLFAEAATQAMIAGRSHLMVQDVRDVAVRTLRGRIEVKAEAEIAGKTVEVLIGDMVEEVFGAMRVSAPLPAPAPESEPEQADEADSGDGEEGGEEAGAESEPREGEEPSAGEGGGSGEEGGDSDGASDEGGESSESGDSGDGAEQSGQQPGSGSQPSQSAGQSSSSSQGSSPSPRSGGGQPLPQTRPTGGQGLRPSSFTAGLRAASREEPWAGRPFAKARW